MAEKDADDNSYPIDKINNSDAAQAFPEDGASPNPMRNEGDKKKDSDFFDINSSLPSYESSKKEENPFSFKKFLNQDLSAQKNKGARKKTYTPNVTSSSTNLSSPNHSLNKNPYMDVNPRMINATDVSSVLPDFVQDHLVIEQCYLSGSSSTIDIDNLNLQNLPDLNLEHRNVHFMLNSDRETDHSTQHSSNHFSNLPDFTLGATNFQDKSTRRKNDTSNGSDSSQASKQRTQMSSSPSVPLDLPSYDNNDAAIPFDLPIPAEDQNNSNRGRNPETVSKSLPDFLSDGPIKKELDENLQNNRGNLNLMANGLPSPEISSVRSENDRLIREIEYLRRQLIEKNRRLEVLETELEHLHSADQRETASLEYALQEVENNLKQTSKRASNAEDMVLKLKQENKLLKSEICSLRSENVELRLLNCEPQPSTSKDNKSQAIAKELRNAANKAEQSLRTLLMGVDNLRALANLMENSPKYQGSTDDFLLEDSASGPAL